MKRNILCAIIIAALFTLATSLYDDEIFNGVFFILYLVSFLTIALCESIEDKLSKDLAIIILFFIDMVIMVIMVVMNAPDDFVIPFMINFGYVEFNIITH
jgi:hypothetical protein